MNVISGVANYFSLELSSHLRRDTLYTYSETN